MVSAAADPIDLSVCVFAWNEVETLESVIRAMSEALSAAAPSHEIVVIDDGSTDGSGELADRLAVEIPRVRAVHHDGNQGLGPVYRTGFETARGRFLTFFPGDGQFAPAIAVEFYRRISAEREPLDLVLGYLPARPDPIGKVLSTVERILYRALVGPMPRFQGIFMIRTDVLRRTRLTSSGRGWGVVMELILRVYREGHRVVSLPTQIRPRTAGASKVNNWRAIRTNLKQLVTLRSTLRS
jgi:glycosyltransferase involved in cell wall biosynthesis